MRVVQQIDEMQALARARVGTVSTALVPTMGALHEGHLSLIRMAREIAREVDVSIFVNPTQFGPGEDLDRYPRPLEQDLEACRREGVTTVFCPDADEMYPSDWSTHVSETRLSTGLCGSHRSGHFDGVVTVVAKLFNIMLPTVAVFGQKDYQQARVIQRMVRDLSFPVEIVVAPIVRDPDGLALSSRNRYLSEEERARALGISKGLKASEAAVAAGERDVEVLQAALQETLRTAGLDPQYAEFVDAETLQPVSRIEDPTLVAVAACVGDTRLIDNMVLTPPV
jgi:pantoate--beta-alanine ligase